MTGGSESSKPIRLFYSYSHDDESFREQLEKHLALLKRTGVIEEWHDRQIGAGTEWEGQINDNLEQADVILLLISASFLASDYCFDKEMTRAMERHDAGKARVIPVILRQRGSKFMADAAETDAIDLGYRRINGVINCSILTDNIWSNSRQLS